MQVTAEMDAGDIYQCTEFDIDIDDTNESIEEKVSHISIDMLIPFLQNPSVYKATPQVGVPTYTQKWTGGDEQIDWSRGDVAVHNQVRALGSGRTKINGMDVKILKTKLQDGKLEILQLQPAGKKPMDWRSFVNGLRGETVKIGE
jgi:methionyl-tRNA formyltransferase